MLYFSRSVDCIARPLTEYFVGIYIPCALGIEKFDSI